MCSGEVGVGSWGEKMSVVCGVVFGGDTFATQQCTLTHSYPPFAPLLQSADGGGAVLRAHNNRRQHPPATSASPVFIYLRHERHEVVRDALGVLPHPPALMRADGVEVPQEQDVPRFVRLGHVSKNLLDHVLGSTCGLAFRNIAGERVGGEGGQRRGQKTYGSSSKSVPREYLFQCTTCCVIQGGCVPCGWLVCPARRPLVRHASLRSGCILFRAFHIYLVSHFFHIRGMRVSNERWWQQEAASVRLRTPARTVRVGDAHPDAAALVEREPIRLSVYCRRRGKDEFAAPRLLLHALHKVQSTLDVVSEQASPIQYGGAGRGGAGQGGAGVLMLWASNLRNSRLD